MGASYRDARREAQVRFEEADSVLGWELSRIIFEGPGEELTKTSVCQPALFVVGVVIAESLQARGVANPPACALGLSLGELTALTVAGSFDFATGLRVVAERGRLMQAACEATDGTMASVLGGEPAHVEQLAREHDVDIANLNNPGKIVVAGERAKVEALVAAAKGDERFKRVMPLNVAGAFHSRLMLPAAEEFARYLDKVAVEDPKLPVFTNVTGGLVESAAEIKQRLVEQITQTVRWQDCVASAAAMGIGTFYECGPGGVLAGMARRIDRSLSVHKLDEYGALPA